MTVQIALPLTDAQAKACVVAADRLGVEPWEIAVHALALRQALHHRDHLGAGEVATKPRKTRAAALKDLAVKS